MKRRRRGDFLPALKTKARVEVVAALIVRNGKVLVARRPPGKARSGQWEFPGGKAEPGESAEQALAREIEEELGCGCAPAQTFAVLEHEYPDLHVRVLFIGCRLQGEPVRREHAELAWVSPEELARYEFVEADRALLPRIADAIRAGVL